MAQTQGFDRVVSNMMVRYGTTAYLIIPSGSGVYNPDTSSITAPLAKSFKVNILMLDFPLRKDGIEATLDSEIQQADKMVYVQPNKEVPLPRIDPTKDKMKIGNDTWKIVGMKEENPTLSDSIVLILYVKR